MWVRLLPGCFYKILGHVERKGGEEPLPPGRELTFIFRVVFLLSMYYEGFTKTIKNTGNSGLAFKLLGRILNLEKVVKEKRTKRN